MTIALWTVQIVLALIFLGAGGMKLLRSRDALRDTLGDLVDTTPMPAIRALGGAEVAAAIGLVAPQATGILPVLTSAAAAGVVLVMLGAIGFHFKRREYPMVALTALIAAAAIFVIWGHLPR